MSAENGIKANTAQEHRSSDRKTSELKTIVQVKESEDESWKEIATVTTVSRNGAGFSLSRPCAVGRLVTLVMPLDPALRAYDESAELYPVMGLVQYCNEGMIDADRVYHVGVGFIGKVVPESFKSDPRQNYRISGMRKDGLWDVTETDSQYKNRKQPRHWISIPATITLIQRADRTNAKEETYTKNIGAGGVSVACSLLAAVGDKVKFACKELDFYSIAIIRNRKVPKNETPTIHLEFIDNVFPIEKLIVARAAEPVANHAPSLI
ncbi:hypothetical protein BH10ACI3_BH10ACI3_25260 [soil metagenome]